MSITTTITSKGQLTIPKAIRDKLGIKPGTKVEIYPSHDSFIGKPQRKSRIFEFAGDLSHLDKGESFRKIRNSAQSLAAKEITGK